MALSITARMLVLLLSLLEHAKFDVPQTCHWLSETGPILCVSNCRMHLENLQNMGAQSVASLAFLFKGEQLYNPSIIGMQVSWLRSKRLACDFLCFVLE